MRRHSKPLRTRVLALAVALGMTLVMPSFAAAERTAGPRFAEILDAALAGLWSTFLDLTPTFGVVFAADGETTGDGTTSGDGTIGGDDGTTGDPGGLDPGSGTGSMDPNGSA